MIIKEKFKKIMSSLKVDYDLLPEADKKYQRETTAFAEMYDKFKKENNLNNLYFSRVVHINEVTTGIIEVYYVIVDLYLEYLNVNDAFPQWAVYNPFVIKEQYMYNTPMEWLFRDSMVEALERSDKLIRKGNYSIRKSNMYEGVTEIIKLSNPSNGLPGMIVERVPMTREELIDKE